METTMFTGLIYDHLNPHSATLKSRNWTSNLG
jgi:hypothetical protein